MSFLIDRIREGAKNFQIVAWPGTTIKVKMRILSRAEYQEANFEAHRHFFSQDVPVADHTVVAYEEEKLVQLLYRALEEVSGEGAGKPVAENIDLFRAAITKDEMDELIKAYSILEEEVSPNSDHMSEAEYNVFLEALKKKPEEMLSSVRSIAFARKLLRSMAAPSES